MRLFIAAAVAAAYRLVAAVIVLLLILGAAAYAQDESVTLPWGDWLAAILGQVIMIAGTVATVIVAWAMKFLPATLKAYIDQQRVAQVEQLLERAIGYGVNAVQGAVKGKTLDVRVGSAVLANALQYAVDSAPGWLVKWMGGEEGIRDKIIARLPLEADATAANIK